MLVSNPIRATRVSDSGLPQALILTDNSQDLSERDTSFNNDNTIGNISETETLGPSSPELPPLSAPGRVGFTPRTPRADSLSSESAFYTASWGSPYDLTSIPAGRHSHRRNSSALSLDEIDEESPQIAFGLSHLIPSRLTAATVHVTPTRPSTPTGWSPSQDTPRIASVSTVDLETVKIVPRDLFKSLSKHQKRSIDHSVGGKTVTGNPTVQEFEDIGVVEGKSQSTKGHRSHLTNRTLRQEDILATTLLSSASATMDSSKYATESPKTRSGSGSTPSKATSQPLSPQHKNAQFPPPFLDVHPDPQVSTIDRLVPRTKKRLAYKGKACWINLPIEPPRGGDSEAPYPMSARDIAQRIKRFQDEGFDTSGFDHENNVVPHQDHSLAARTQTCAVFPLPAEKDSSGKGPKAAVQIPDIKQWQAYVSQLKEAKLRALGVSLGDEPEQLNPLSRVPSSQFAGLPIFSPPLPTSSAGSQRMGPGGTMFPHGFVPGSSNHTSTRSIASPISALSNPRQGFGHMHRQSMFTSPPLMHQQALSPNGFQSWSPQPFVYHNATVSTSSPGLSSGAVDMRSPISPLGSFVDAAPFQFPQRTELVAQLHNQKQQQILRQSQIFPLRPASTLAEVPEAESDEEIVPSTTRSVPPELFNPRPGHRHNISEKLEENVSKGFKIEKAHEQTLQDAEDDGKSPIDEHQDSKARSSVPAWRQNAPAVVSDTPVAVGRAQERPATSSPALPVKDRKDGVGRTYALEYNSDADTNPSDFGFSSPAQPALDLSSISNPWENDPTFQPKSSGSRPSYSSKHSSKLSLTGLNVAAKEFNPNANPAAIFNPSIFSASSFGFKPESIKPFVPRSSTQSKPNSPSSFAKSVNTPPKPKFNIDAPEFSPSGFGSAALSKSEFHFASGPVLKPTAPAFEPGAPAVISDGVFGSSTSSESNRLFGSVNFTQFANHEKKTKAVPILPPKPGYASERELLDDEEGRLGQSFTKRTRRDTDEAQSVAIFAVSAPTLSKSDSHSAEAKSDTLVKDNENASELEDGAISDIPAEVKRPDTVADAKEDESMYYTLNASTPKSASLKAEEISNPSRRSSLPHGFVDSPDYTPTTPIGAQIDDSTVLTPKSLSDNDDRMEGASEPLISPPSSAIASKNSVDADYATIEHDEDALSLSPPLRKLPSSVRYYDDIDHPSFQEIDAIMQQFNDAGSDFGIERELPSWPGASPGSLATARPTLLPPNVRSDAPSPSPGRGMLNVMPQDLDSASITQDPFSDGRAAIGYESPIRQLNDGEDNPVSDWDDFSSGDEERIRARGPFLDSHVSELIHSTLGKRLGPLEKQLELIQSTIVNLASNRSGRRAQSRATAESDADDEDDEVVNSEFNSRAWSRSPMRDRKVERMRAVIQEALANHKSQIESPTGDATSIVILDALRDMKAAMTIQFTTALQHDVKSAVEAALSEHNTDPGQSFALRVDDIRAAVEAAVASHAFTTDSSRNLAGDESSIITELLTKNAEAVSKAAEEAEARKSAERQEIESSRLLALAEEELTLLRASIKDNEQQIASHGDRARIAEQRLAENESNSAGLHKKASDLSEMNIALKSAVDEYRLSHDKWRSDVDTVTRDKERLAAEIGRIKVQAEEAVRIRQNMGDRLEKLSTNAEAVTSKLADERAKWHAADSEYRNRINYWKDKAEAERVTRENFERKIEGIEAQDRENMKLRYRVEHLTQENGRLEGDIQGLLTKDREAQKMSINLEHLQNENSKLEEIVDRLRNESQQHELAAEKYAREWREARDNGHQEVQRTRILLQTEVEAANSHAAIVRNGFEGEISRLRSELESAKMDVDAARAKEDLIMEQEADSKRDAIREVIESKNIALAEQKHAFEERLEDLRRQHRRDLDHVIENKNQSETFLREAHAQRLADMDQQNQRSLEQAYEDKERVETYLNERLAVADSKVELMEDKIAHLTLKLTSAQSAAAAAAQAAQVAQAAHSAQGATTPHTALSMPMPFMAGSTSSALRESIQVLQDQLQERETHIESLELQLSEVDDTLPETLRARNTEVSWLRELLGVRIDDLSEVVNLLARDDFDREAVRNAAIRIKTGLKMNIEERDRQADGSAPLSAGAANLAASIQNFATPRAAQLARVIGEWRSTPARRSSNSSPGFLSGLMTPPATNLRQTPEPANTAELRRGSTASSSSQINAGHQLNLGQPLSERRQEKSRSGFPSFSLHASTRNEPPKTPLLNPRAYDDDAESGRYSAGGFYDDEESTVDGTPRKIRERLDT